MAQRSSDLENRDQRKILLYGDHVSEAGLAMHILRRLKLPVCTAQMGIHPAIILKDQRKLSRDNRNQ